MGFNLLHVGLEGVFYQIILLQWLSSESVTGALEQVFLVIILLEECWLFALFLIILQLDETPRLIIFPFYIDLAFFRFFLLLFLHRLLFFQL
mmetsp:Transcript_35403/g.34444  ORF Transcript_35403/g.34444 Transcript_35403/m.34444 type:complete len:92 (+) Transcript_35403:1233-1508(+)